MPQKQKIWFWTAAILAQIGFVAWLDSVVVPNISLRLLYLVPLLTSALVHSPPLTFALIALCLVLRESFGPYENETWQVIIRSAIALAVYSSAVLLVHSLKRQRLALAKALDRQKENTGEREIAITLQQRLLPPEALQGTGWEAAARFCRGREFDGVFCDLFEETENRIWVLSADVSGRALSGVYLLPAVRGLVRTLAVQHRSALEICLRVNEMLCEMTEEHQYIALMVGSLDFEAGRFEYVNAGHYPPLLVKPDEGLSRWLDKGGPPTGILGEVTYEQGAIDVKAGDIIVVYSSGCVEARGQDGRHFSTEQLQSLATTLSAKSSAQILSAIENAVTEFAAPGGPAEDYCLLVLQRHRPA